MSIRDKAREFIGDSEENLASVKQLGRSALAGYQAAGDVVAQSPIAKEWVRVLNIHPEQVVRYGEAVCAHATGRGPKPDPEDYRGPVVTPLKRGGGPGAPQNG